MYKCTLNYCDECNRRLTGLLLLSCTFLFRWITLRSLQLLVDIKVLLNLWFFKYSAFKVTDRLFLYNIFENTDVDSPSETCYDGT